MSDAKLMMPLFCNGMFNCGGRRIRAERARLVRFFWDQIRKVYRGCGKRIQQTVKLRDGEPSVYRSNAPVVIVFYHPAQLNRTLQQRCQVLRKNGCAIVPAQENCAGDSGSIHV